MIAAGASAQALQRAAVTHGMATMRDVAIARVRGGETTLQEVERVIGDSVEDKSQEKSGAPVSILLVNADPAWRRMARALLESDDVRVVEAVDAAQAMQRMSGGEQFALTLTDMHMPSSADALPAATTATDLDRPELEWPVAAKQPNTSRQAPH